MGLFEVPFFSDKPIQAGDLFKIIQVQDDASTVELAHLSEFRYGCGQLFKSFSECRNHVDGMTDRFLNFGAMHTPATLAAEAAAKFCDQLTF